MWNNISPHSHKHNLSRSITNTTALNVYQRLAAQRCYVHKTCLRENCKDTKLICPVMWTYHILLLTPACDVLRLLCAFDPGMYCDYYVLLTPACTATIIDKITIFCNDANKTSTSVKLLTINILHYMSQRSNVGLKIKELSQQMDLKTFVEEWNVHNAFALPLKFDKLFQ